MDDEFGEIWDPDMEHEYIDSQPAPKPMDFGAGCFAALFFVILIVGMRGC